MNRVIRLTLVTLTAASLAWGQTGAQTETTAAPGDRLGPDMGEKSAAENARGSSVAARAPGRLIDRARARHLGLTEDRAAAQLGGDTSGLTGAGQQATGTQDNGLGGLLDSVLGSGLLGALGGGGIDLGSLLGGGGSSLGGLLGGGSTTGGTNTDTTGGSSNIPSNITPEAIQLLENAGFDVNQLFGKANNGESQTPAGGKDESRAQTTQTETPFRVRWSNAMLTTLFTGLIAGVGTDFFVDALKDFLRPALAPETVSAAGASDPNLGAVAFARGGAMSRGATV